MGTATNFVVFDKSFQAASLGDASLIAIVTTIQVLLHAVEELLRRNRKERHRSNGYIKCKRRSLVSIHNEYGNLFERAEAKRKTQNLSLFFTFSGNPESQKVKRM